MKIQSDLSLLPKQYAVCTEALCKISETYFCAGRLSDTLSLLAQGTAIVENREIDPQDHTKLLLQRAKMLNWNTFMNGDRIDTSLPLLEQAQQMAESAGNEQQLAYALLYTGTAYDLQKLVTDEGDFAKPLAYFRQALERFTAINDEKGKAEAHFSIAMNHQRVHQLEEMKAHLIKTLEIAEGHGFTFEKAEALWHLAYIHAHRSELEPSLQYSLETLRLRKELGLKIMLPTTFRPLGLLYDFLGDHEQALDYYQQSLTLAQEMDLKIPQMDALYALGGWQLKHGDVAQARTYTEQGHEIAQGINHQRGMATGVSQLEKIANPQSE